PQTLYKKFSNAVAYYKQENKTVIDKKIRSYFNSISLHVYCHQLKFTSHNTNNSGSSSLPNNTSLIHISLQCEDELSKNAISQRDAFQKITAVTKKISEYEQIYLISTDESFKKTL
ncbi:1162_t:CDS:2, partial [Dentiscutata heterogama]